MTSASNEFSLKINLAKTSLFRSKIFTIKIKSILITSSLLIFTKTDYKKFKLKKPQDPLYQKPPTSLQFLKFNHLNFVYSPSHFHKFNKIDQRNIFHVVFSFHLKENVSVIYSNLHTCLHRYLLINLIYFRSSPVCGDVTKEKLISKAFS